MQSEQPRAEISITRRILEDWGPAVRSRSDVLALLYLAEHGYVGEQGMPADERPQFAEAIGLSRERAYRRLKALIGRGLVIQTGTGRAARFALNPDWQSE